MTDQHEDARPDDEKESPEAGFMTDTLAVDTGVAELPDETDSATVFQGPDLSHLDTRPSAGEPRDYHFPKFERFRLDNGLTVLSAHMPGRALLAANLVMAGGGAAEPEELSGVTTMTGRALTEGTTKRDAMAFIEASERLGAELHADASWEALTATLEVPRSRFADAVSLLAEMILRAGIPGVRDRAAAR